MYTNTHTHTHTHIHIYTACKCALLPTQKTNYCALALIPFLSQGLFNPHMSHQHTHIPASLDSDVHTHTHTHTHTSSHTNKLTQFLPLNQALSAALEPDMRPGTEEMSDVSQCYNSAEPTTWEGIHLLYFVLMGNQSQLIIQCLQASARVLKRSREGLSRSLLECVFECVCVILNNASPSMKHCSNLSLVLFFFNRHVEELMKDQDEMEASNYAL